MILGTYWCEVDKSWVRFIVENQTVRTEISRGIADNPITEPWAPIAEKSWQLSYSLGNQQKIADCYALIDGRLYKTCGSVNPHRGNLEIGLFQPDTGHWSSYNMRGNMLNPFSTGYQPDASVTPYDLLPLTPEMHAEKIREQEIEAERQRIEQLAEEERRREAWLEYQQNNRRSQGIQAAAGPDPLFREGALNFLYNQFDNELPRFNPSGFENCALYLQALKTVIEDNTNDLHQAIKRMAARTDLDREEFPDYDERLRRTLLKFKQTFYFNLLREEARSLSEQFGIPCPILSAEELDEEEVLPELVVPQQGQLPPVVNEDVEFQQMFEGIQPLWDLLQIDEPVDEEAAELQRAIDESLAEEQRAWERANRPQVGRQVEILVPQLQDDDPELLRVIEVSRLEEEKRQQADWQELQRGIAVTRVQSSSRKPLEQNTSPRMRRRSSPQSQQVIHEVDFNHWFAKLKEQTDALVELGDSSSAKYDPEYLAVGKQAALLNKRLTNAAQDYFRQSATTERTIQFKRACMDAIRPAKMEFGHHRGWGAVAPFLRGIVGLFAGLSIIPGLCVAIFSEHGFFRTFYGDPPTKSLGCLEEFEEKFRS